MILHNKSIISKGSKLSLDNIVNYVFFAKKLTKKSVAFKLSNLIETSI